MYSVKNKTWQYLLMFSLIIIIFLWLFQGLFFNEYYKYAKRLAVSTVQNNLIKHQNDKDFNKRIDNLAFDNGVCIEIIDKKLNTIYKSKYVGKGCFLANDDKNSNFKLDFISSKETSNSKVVTNPEFNNSTILTAKKMNNNKYIFVNSSLEPIDSTAKIIRDQLIIITIILIILSFIVSYIVARHLTKPLVEINNESKKLAKGDFNNKISVKTDISEINELTNTLNYTRLELAKTDELRRDLLSNVSHDMKTPLTMIKAYTEMMNDLHKDNYNKRIEDGNIIIEEVDRLTLLVNDILDLSKMQSNISELKIEEFDLIEIINKIIKNYSILVQNNNYKFIFNHDDKKLLIKADKKKIEQVLYNLITNAINYVGDDKKIIIEVINNEDILINVTDHGKGISKDDIPYIWDKYYKSKKKYKRNKIGSGLGLSIVKSILEEHNYEYGVKSELNKGSTFWFKIKK